MKKVIFALTFLVTSFTLYAQNKAYPSGKRTKYGINFGLNYSNVINKDLPSNGSISNDLGFQLGVLADYKISRSTDQLSISPKAELAFTSGQVNFTNPNSPDLNYLVMPVFLGLGVDFVFILDQGDFSPYFYAGLSTQFPIANTTSTDLIYPTKTNLGLNIGIGLEKIVYYFNVAPELRYSLGLTNISKDSNLGALRLHTLSFIINFTG